MVKRKVPPEEQGAEAKPETGEAEEGSQPGQVRSEIKVIIVMKADRIMLGVQSPDCDPVYRTLQGTMDDALQLVPTLVGEANLKWDASPRNPKADLPAPPPSAAPVTASTASGSRGSSKPKDQPLMF